jgi:hypothetical protein
VTARKAAAKELEDAINLDQRPPEPMCRSSVIGRVDAVLRKVDRVGHLVRRLVDDHRDAEAVEEVSDLAIEVGNRLRLERERPFLAPTCADDP